MLGRLDTEAWQLDIVSWTAHGEAEYQGLTLMGFKVQGSHQTQQRCEGEAAEVGGFRGRRRRRREWGCEGSEIIDEWATRE